LSYLPAAPGVNRKQYCFGALLWNLGRAVFRVAPRKTSAHFLTFLKQVYRTVKRLRPGLRIIFVLDNYSIHKTQAIQDWLALHTDDVSVLWLPTYAPQLNPVEKIWWLLKQRFLRNRTFRDLPDLRGTVRSSLRYLSRHPHLIQSVTACWKV
jgi:transposase